MWWEACAAAALWSGAMADLTLRGPRCGELTCAMDQYCSSETSRCAPCTDICEPKHHNYDAGLCVRMCQDYIHQLRFVSRTAGGAADVTNVATQARAALIISSVLLAIVVLTFLFKCYRYTRDNRSKLTWKHLKQKLQISKKSRVKAYPTDLTHRNPHAETAKPGKRELRLEMRTEPAPPPPRAARLHDTDSGPKTVSTCVSTRHPVEDTTLDYSYDNMALNVTPPPAAAVQHF